MRKIVLASGSPQRKIIFERLGLPFIVDVSNAEEDLTQKLPARKLAESIALKKALTVAARHPDAIVVGADTVLAIGKKMFGKHESVAAVRRTLRYMSGKWQLATTGLAIIDTKKNRRVVTSGVTHLKLRKLAVHEIDRYARSGEWRDKAGGYDIRGIGGTFVEEIRGGYDNIVGVPVPELLRALKKLGVSI